ncbi:LanA [Symbiodinium sp. CCMP2592]|nr:LanA [Symbiodinium sp. CCMP2592]
MEPILETEEAESSLQSSQTNFKKLRRLPSPAEWKEFSRSLGVIRAGLEAGDPKFGMSLQEAKEVYERVEDVVNLVMKHQGQVKNLEDREKKKTADLASSQQEIMNLKKQLSLATQRLTEAEESVKESRQQAVPPEEVEQLFMRLADFESLAQNVFDAEALSEVSVASILGGLTGSKPRSAPGSPYTPLEDKENVEVETSKLRRAVEEAEEEAKSAKQTSVEARLEAEGYREELEKVNGEIISVKKELGDVQRALCKETRDLRTMQNVVETQHQAVMKEQQRSHALAEELRRVKVEGVLNATIGKEALSTGVPASKEDVETRRDDVSETTASSSSAEAVVAIFREHVADTQGLLEDEMANVNTVLDVQEEVLLALRRVAEDRTYLRSRLKIKQSETDQVRRDLENAEATNDELTTKLQCSEEALQDARAKALQHACAEEQVQMKYSETVAAAQALQDAIAALQSQVEELQTQVEVKQQKLTAVSQTLEAETADAAAQLVAARKKVESHESELRESVLAAEKLQATNDELTTKLQCSEQALQDLEAQKQAAAADLEIRSTAVARAEADKMELQAKLADREAQLFAAVQAQEASKELIEALRGEAVQMKYSETVAAAQDANAALQSQVEELQTQVEVQQQKLTAASQTLEDLEAQKQAAAADLEIRSTAVARAEADKMELQAKLADREAQLFAAVQAQEASKELIEALRGEAVASASVLPEVQMKYSETVAAAQALQDANAALQSQVEELQTQVEVQQQKLTAASQTLEAETADAAAQLVAARKKVESHESELRESVLAAEKLQATNDELTNKLQCLEQALQDLEAQKQAAAAELEIRSTAVARAEADKMELQAKFAELRGQLFEAVQAQEASKELIEALRGEAASASVLPEVQMKYSETVAAAQALQDANAALQSQVEELQTQVEVQQQKLTAASQTLEAETADAAAQLVAARKKVESHESELRESVLAAEKLQATNDELTTKLQCSEQALQDLEAQKQAAAAELEIRSTAVARAEADKMELQAKVQVQSEAACFDISTPRSIKSPWAESPEAAPVAEVAGAEQSGLLAENRLLRERLSAFEEEKATSLQALREQVMLLARENYDLKHGVRQAEAPLVQAKEVPAGSGAASEGDQRWWLSAIFSPFLTEGDMREIHAQSRLDEADGRNEG